MLNFSLKNIKNKTLFKVVTLILCFAMVVPNLYIRDVNAATIAEINKDIDRIEAQQEAHQNHAAKADRLSAHFQIFGMHLFYDLYIFHQTRS